MALIPEQHVRSVLPLNTSRYDDACRALSRDLKEVIMNSCQLLKCYDSHFPSASPHASQGQILCQALPLQCRKSLTHYHV